MRLRTKVLLAQAPLLAALVALGAVATAGVGSLGRRADGILRENYRSVLAAQRMKESLERIDSGLLFAAAGRPELGEEQIVAQSDAFEHELRAQQANVTEPGEHAATDGLSQAWADYGAAVARYRAIGAPAARIEAYFGDVEPSFRRVKDAANHVLDLNQDAMSRKSDDAAAAARALRDSVVLAAAVACALGALASAALTARILRPIRVLQQTTRRLGEGDLAVRARVDDDGEIGRLADEFNAMADRLQRYRESTLGELIEAQSAMHAAIDSLPDPVLVVGPGGEIRDANSAAARILSPLLATAAAPTVDLVPEPVRAAVVAARDRVLRPGGAAAVGATADVRSAVRLDRPDGPVLLLPRATPVRAPEGDVVAATVVLQDVTRLVRHDEMKDDLVATVAHEFRTPLTSLRMAIHLCLEEVAGPTTDTQRDLLTASRGDCERLQRLVDEMLDLARIRAGRDVLVRRDTEASALVHDAIEAARSAARDRGVVLASEISPEAGTVNVDRDRIAVVLGNLLANAVRHSPESGQVTVSALLVPGAVRFEVADQGPGVPESEREAVFERGAQVRRSGSGESPRIGGAGLGLWIAREIVRAHGGEIGIVDGAAGGSRFWFTLPRP